MNTHVYMHMHVSLCGKLSKTRIEASKLQMENLINAYLLSSPRDVLLLSDDSGYIAKCGCSS